MSPKQVCFIWDRNTVSTNGIFTSFIEDSILNGLDTTVSRNLQIDEIVGVESHKWTMNQLYAFRSLLLHVFWRSPKNDDMIDFANENFPLSFTGLQFVNSETGEVDDPKMVEKMKREEVIRKIYQALLPIKSILLKGNIHRWRRRCCMKIPAKACAHIPFNYATFG